MTQTELSRIYKKLFGSSRTETRRFSCDRRAEVEPGRQVTETERNYLPTTGDDEENLGNNTEERGWQRDWDVNTDIDL